MILFAELDYDLPRKAKGTRTSLHFERINSERHHVASDAFQGIRTLLELGRENGPMSALAEATVGILIQDPGNEDHYCNRGSEALRQVLLNFLAFK